MISKYTIIKYTIFDFSVLGNTEIYLGTVIGTTLLFIFAVKNPFIVSDNNFFVKLGEKYSLYIYVSHLIFISLIENFLNINGLLEYVVPIFVVLCSFLVSYIYSEIKHKITKN